MRKINVNYSKRSFQKLKGLILILFTLLTIANTKAETYNIRLIVENDEFEFICDNNQTIYEAAKMYGIELNYKYDGGATDVSLAKLNYGIIDLSKQSYLNAEQIESKLILLTVAYPKSDCEINLNVLQNTSEHNFSSYGNGRHGIIEVMSTKTINFLDYPLVEGNYYVAGTFLGLLYVDVEWPSICMPQYRAILIPPFLGIAAIYIKALSVEPTGYWQMYLQNHSGSPVRYTHWGSPSAY